MIIFEKLEYELPLDETTHIFDSYVTLVQKNAFQKVEITPEECQNSVRLLSRLSKKAKKKK